MSLWPASYLGCDDSYLCRNHYLCETYIDKSVDISYICLHMLSIALCCVMLYSPGHAMPCYPHSAMLCCAVLCCAVLCCAVLCCAVLCRAVPCRAVPCRAVTVITCLFRSCKCAAIVDASPLKTVCGVDGYTARHVTGLQHVLSWR